MADRRFVTSATSIEIEQLNQFASRVRPARNSMEARGSSRSEAAPVANAGSSGCPLQPWNARSEDAARQLAVVAKNAGDNPFTHYNAGLVYFEGKNYEQALLEAHRAIELGFPREELREKLKGAGKWSEPVSGATSSAPTAPAASAASAASPDAPQKQ